MWREQERIQMWSGGPRNSAQKGKTPMVWTCGESRGGYRSGVDDLETVLRRERLMVWTCGESRGGYRCGVEDLETVLRRERL